VEVAYLPLSVDAAQQVTATVSVVAPAIETVVVVLLLLLLLLLSHQAEQQHLQHSTTGTYCRRQHWPSKL
jgi:uncharacterized membrane protein (DUF2068 family)